MRCNLEIEAESLPMFGMSLALVVCPKWNCRRESPATCRGSAIRGFAHRVTRVLAAEKFEVRDSRRWDRARGDVIWHNELDAARLAIGCGNRTNHRAANVGENDFATLSMNGEFFGFVVRRAGAVFNPLVWLEPGRCDRRILVVDCLVLQAAVFPGVFAAAQPAPCAAKRHGPERRFNAQSKNASRISRKRGTTSSSLQSTARRSRPPPMENPCESRRMECDAIRLPATRRRSRRTI